MKKKTLQIFILFILYILGLLGDSYYGFTQNIPVLNTIYGYLFQIFDYTRNGIFYVPMFLSIGFFIGKEKKQKNVSLFLSFLFLVLMLVEGFLLHRFDLQRHSSMYLFLVPTAYCLFHWVLQNTSGTNKKIRNLATWLYILHPWFIVIIRGIAKIIHLENLLVENSILNYLAVVIATICFLLVLDKIKTR